MEKTPDILLIGGGLVGSLLQIALQATPYQTLLCEAMPLWRGATTAADDRLDVRAIALNVASRQFLEHLGLWERLLPHATPIHTILVSSAGQFGTTRLQEEHSAAPLGHVIALAQLQQIFCDHLNTTAVYDATRLTAYDEAAQVALFEQADGRTLSVTPRVIVAADGSPAVRGVFQTPPLQSNLSSEVAVTTTIRLKHAHEGIAYEHFTPHGPLACLPLTDRCMSVVWCVPPSQAQILTTGTDAAFIAAFEKVFGDRLGKILQVGVRQCFPLQQTSLPVPYRWPVMWIGNAAQTLHPVAGQGFNLAVRDIAHFCQCLAIHGLTPELFTQYHTHRRSDRRRTMWATETLLEIFSASHWSMKRLRSLGLVGLNGLPMVKTAVIRQASGLGGRAPQGVLKPLIESSVGPRHPSSVRHDERSPRHGECLSMTANRVVVGAGPVGLATALALSHEGRRVAVVDKGPLEGATACLGRVYALTPTTLRWLASLGVQLAKTAACYERMQIWIAETNAALTFETSITGQSALGAIVDERDLKQALLEKIHATPSITLYPEQMIQSLESSESGMHLASATHRWQVPLACFADGARSVIYNTFGVQQTTRSYQQHAIVTVVQTQKPHAQTCYQVFLPEGPLAFLPLQDPHQCAIVWSTTPAQASALSQDVAAFQQAIEKASEGILGALTALGTLTTFPLQMRHTQQYAGANWLLLGDAAHTVHPLAGLGLNFGFADVRCWQQQESQLRPGDLSGALGAYHRERYAEMTHMIAGLDGIKWLFAPHAPWLNWLVAQGLRTCQQLPALKRQLIGVAARL